MIQSGNMEKEIDIRAVQAGYDLATLFRVANWILLMRDQRPPQTLVAAAFNEARGFIDTYLAQPDADRKSLMRGVLIDWCCAVNIHPDPGMIEALTGLVAQAVDENVTSQYSTGLQGETA